MTSRDLTILTLLRRARAIRTAKYLAAWGVKLGVRQ